MGKSKTKRSRQSQQDIKARSLTDDGRAGIKGFKAPAPAPLPQVSICTVTYNRSPFLPLLEQCILAQTYPRDLIEWILVDDSDDGRPYFEPTPGTGLQVCFERLSQRLPLGPKRNLSHSLCRGEIIVYMDDDDYYPPERVSHAVEALTNSDRLVAGSSVLPIMFLPEREAWVAGPYGPNHATAGTFAFKKELLNITHYQEHARISEEKAFLRNYTIPMVQLDPFKTIVCMGHSVNTFDKRNLIQGGKNPKLKKAQLDINAPGARKIIEQYEAVTLAEKGRPAPLQTMAKVSVDVIIPSRSRPNQESFLRGALESIAEQTHCSQLDVRVIIATDPGCSLESLPETNLTVDIVEAAHPSQAAAVNRALEQVQADFVAFLEDDDQWHPRFLELAYSALTQPLEDGTIAGFISSTQLEEDSRNVIIRINDLANPSGWLMYRKTMDTVGCFDESYQWHPDIDWLGRLASHPINRLHMVESTAPFHHDLATQIRPLLGEVLGNSNLKVRLCRHKEVLPLVGKLSHSDSRTALTTGQPTEQAESAREIERLVHAYGHLPR